jgi:hypothetical protein
MFRMVLSLLFTQFSNEQGKIVETFRYGFEYGITTIHPCTHFDSVIRPPIIKLLSEVKISLYQAYCNRFSKVL